MDDDDEELKDNQIMDKFPNWRSEQRDWNSDLRDRSSQ